MSDIFAKIRAAKLAQEATQNPANEANQNAAPVTTAPSKTQTAAPINRLTAFMGKGSPVASSVPESAPADIPGVAGSTEGESETTEGSSEDPADLATEPGPDTAVPVAAGDSSLEKQEAVPERQIVPALMRLNTAVTGTVIEAAPQAEKLDIIPPGEEGIAERFRRLDSMIQADHGINEISMGAARMHVREIAVELKEHPEYMGIVKPLDIHNVMVFMRATLATAEAGFVKKGAAAEKKTQKKIGSAKFDFSSFAANLVAKPGSADAAAQGGLDALASFDSSKLPALNRRG